MSDRRNTIDSTEAIISDGYKKSGWALKEEDLEKWWDLIIIKPTKITIFPLHLLEQTALKTWTQHFSFHCKRSSLIPGKLLLKKKKKKAISRQMLFTF